MSKIGLRLAPFIEAKSDGGVVKLEREGLVFESLDSTCVASVSLTFDWQTYKPPCTIKVG